MSIKDFVADLSTDQLDFCADEVARRLRKLKEGEKVQLWVVRVDGLNRFATTSTQSAYEWIARFCSARIARGEFAEFSLDTMFEFPSQVESWTNEINDKPEAA